MAEVVLSAKAHAALRAKKLELILKHHRREISEQEALRQFFDFAKEIIGGSRTEDFSSYMIVKCTDCETEHIIPRGVRAYRCKCKPDFERPTFIGRVD